MYGLLPKELKREGLFCPGRYGMRKGKPTEMQYRANCRMADATNPVCYAPFPVVMDAFKKGGYDGIGLGIFGDYAAIDIYHCVSGGKLYIRTASLYR